MKIIECRNIIIDELNSTSSDSIDEISKYDDASLIGKIYGAKMLAYIGAKTMKELAETTTSEQKHELVIETKKCLPLREISDLEKTTQQELNCLLKSNRCISPNSPYYPSLEASESSESSESSDEIRTIPPSDIPTFYPTVLP
eukprot:382759_1